MRILTFASNLQENSTGRIHVLWELAQQVGWTMDIWAPGQGPLWQPLRGSEFEKACITEYPRGGGPDWWHEWVSHYDLLIAAKPLPTSLGVAYHASRATGRPLLVDIDDPDLESRLGVGHPLRAVGKAVLRPRTFWAALRMAGITRYLDTIVSNPTLAERYGGTVIPHARRVSEVGTPHTSRHPRVVFVGTVRAHKGLGLIRRAVEALQTDGVRLTVTDTPPRDAHPWEEWVGITSPEVGQRLVRTGDVVVVASNPRSITAQYQLPAKLIDAMMAGRAVITTNLAPLDWAVGAAASSLSKYDVASLVTAIRATLDPATRTRQGTALRTRALELFSVPAVAATFRDACMRAVTTAVRQGAEKH